MAARAAALEVASDNEYYVYFSIPCDPCVSLYDKLVGAMEQLSCRVDNQGRITLPVEWRKAHNIQPGCDVAVLVTDDRLEVQTLDQSLNEARFIVSRHRKGAQSAVDMLHEDRRLEAALEQTEADRHAESI